MKNNFIITNESPKKCYDGMSGIRVFHKILEKEISITRQSGDVLIAFGSLNNYDRKDCLLMKKIS